MFPDVDDVAEVGEADDVFGVHGVPDLVGEFGDILHDVVYPTLLVALPGGRGIHFGRDRDHTSDVARLGLGAGHAAEAGGDKQLAGEGRVLRIESPPGIEDRDGCAVDDALRADVHVGPGGHLAVLADAEGVHALVVVATAVVRNDHAIGHHHARRAGVRGEEAKRVAAVHDERLLLGHFAQVAHHEAVLRPVLEDGAVAPIRDELLGMLGHGRIQVVLDHQHDGRSLRGLRWVVVDGSGVHRVVRHEPVHVDAAIGAELFGELQGQRGMVLLREVAQGIGQGELLLLGREDVFPDRGVRHVRVALTGCGQDVRQTFGQGGLEVGQGQGGRGGGVHLRGLWDCGCDRFPCRIRRDNVCIRWCSNSRVCGGIVP